MQDRQWGTFAHVTDTDVSITLRYSPSSIVTDTSAGTAGAQLMALAASATIPHNE
jgi:hypothetical protein